MNITKPFEYKIEKIGNHTQKWALHTPSGLRWFNTKKAAKSIAEALKSEEEADRIKNAKD